MLMNGCFDSLSGFQYAMRLDVAKALDVPLSSVVLETVNEAACTGTKVHSTSNVSTF
jgi:hypothetical protein